MTNPNARATEAERKADSKPIPPCNVGVYAQMLPALRAVAKEHGYALGLHGSMQRDFDLMAMPWTEQAAPAKVLIEAMAEAVQGFIPFGGGQYRDGEWKLAPMPRISPHGRESWTISFHAQGGMGQHPFIDISVMPVGLLSRAEQAEKERDEANAKAGACNYAAKELVGGALKAVKVAKAAFEREGWEDGPTIPEAETTLGNAIGNITDFGVDGYLNRIKTLTDLTVKLKSERDAARREAEGAKKFLDDLHFVLRAKEGGELFLYDNDGENFGVRYIDTNSTDAAKCKHRILTFDLPHAAACMRQWLEQDAARAATDALARREGGEAVIGYDPLHSQIDMLYGVKPLPRTMGIKIENAGGPDERRREKLSQLAKLVRGWIREIQYRKGRRFRRGKGNQHTPSGRRSKP